MRIRTIKPEFWSNPELAKLPPFTRLLAIGFLNYADDHGYFAADPALVRASLFPFDTDSRQIQTSISELQNIRFLELFAGTNGRTYGKVINFTKHQKIDRPSKSKITPYINFDEPSTSPRIPLDGPSLPGLTTLEVVKSSDFFHVTENQSHGQNSSMEQGTGNREQGTGNTIQGGTGKAEKAEKPKPEKTALMRRTESLFRRREATPWSKVEKDAWGRAKGTVEATSEDEWKALEKFFELPDPPPPAQPLYRRRNLDTLLNHWPSEVSKAMSYFSPNGTTHVNGHSADEAHQKLLKQIEERDAYERAHQRSGS